MSKRLAMLSIAKALGTSLQIGKLIREIENQDMRLELWEKLSKLDDRIIKFDEQFNNTSNLKKLREIRKNVEIIQVELDNLLLLVERKIESQ